MKTMRIFILCLVILVTACFKITEPDLGEKLEPSDGSSLVINPLELTVSNGKTFKIRIYLSNVINILGVYSQIKFNPDYLVYQRYEPVEASNSQIDLNDVTQVMVVGKNEMGDTISVNLGFPGGSGNGVSGTGDIFYLVFKAVRTGTTEIEIVPGARLTDRDLNEIEITQLKGTTVYVE